MSPERITGKIYSYPSDIWSVGLVIYELATGEEPYGGGDDFLTQITKIVEYDEPRLDGKIFSKEFCDFIEKTVKKEPEKRADVEELLYAPNCKLTFTRISPPITRLYPETLGSTLSLTFPFDAA